MSAGDTMQGRRVADGTEPHLYEPGDYGRWQELWWCRAPGEQEEDLFLRPLGNLGNHEVAEHDDGSITVSPSILLTWGEGEGGAVATWHGYLERGVWREV